MSYYRDSNRLTSEDYRTILFFAFAVALFFFALQSLLRHQNINVNTTSQEIGRYQIYPEQRIVFDTADGSVYALSDGAAKTGILPFLAAPPHPSLEEAFRSLGMTMDSLDKK